MELEVPETSSGSIAFSPVAPALCSEPLRFVGDLWLHWLCGISSKVEIIYRMPL